MTNHSLPDLTQQLYDMHARQALIATAIVEHQLGPMAKEDPQLLENFLSARKISGPVKLMVKAAVAPMDTASGLAPGRPSLAAYLAAVDRQSVLGRIGAVRVPSANAVGAVQTSTASAFWIGEQSAKPISSMSFAAMSLAARKLAVNVAVSDELIRFGSADVLGLIERASVSAVATALDTALLDPSNAGIANVKPASLLNGVTATAATGDIQTQAGAALNAISGGAPSRPVLIVSLQSGLRLSALRDLEGLGVRVIVSPAAENRLIAIDADGVVFVDDGGQLKIGTPDVQMDDSPTTPGTSATVLVSSWQRNLKIVRSERWLNWAKRGDAVAYVTVS